MTNKIKKIIFVWISITCLFGWQAGVANVQTLAGQASKRGPEIDFEKRINFYLDLNSKRFINKLAVKEQFLLQMIQNLNAEIQARGAGEELLKEIGFVDIYQDREELIEEYALEVKNILSLIQEMEQLENYMVRTENSKMLGEIQSLKNNLKDALDNRQLYKQKEPTQKDAAALIHEYSAELDSILNLYDFLVRFEQQAKLQNDAEILNEIDQQKRRLVKIIGQYGPEGESQISQRLVEDYVGEGEKIVEILKEVDRLSLKLETDSLLNEEDPQKIKQHLLKAVDQRLIELSGYNKSKQYQGPSISDFLTEWRAQKTADYQARLTQYRIIYSRLLNAAKPSERERMLERAMSDAVMNYSAREYELAEIQLKDILKNFSPYFPQLDGVIYYIAESNYARSFYDEAYQHFEYLVNNYSESKFLSRSLWKLMLICYTYDWKKKFFTFFEKLQSLPSAAGLQDMNGAYYLAGYLNAKMGKFRPAQQYLDKVEKGATYYFPAQYLLGIIYVNLDNYNRAKKIFESLANEKNLPWTDAHIVAIRNEAIIRLGFLHFQRGEYPRAIEVLEQLSRGYDNYDKGLMVQAWANLKTGKYEKSIQKVHNLFSEFMTSNYTYEALILSAHCKQILNETGAAKEDLKYVANAHGVLKLTEEYNKERRRILEQSKELERLETIVLERHDKDLYQDAQKVREMINEALLAFNYRGFSGTQLIEEFNDERKEVHRQIEQLDHIIQQAKQSGQSDLIDIAEKQRTRLIRVLETYQADKSVVNINYFIDHPLATKEGGIKYRRGIVKDMYQDIISEKKRLERTIKETVDLLAQQGSINNYTSEIDLEILEEELSDLRNRLNRLQIWLANNPVEEMHTNFDQWADFSGFGLSDINFKNLLDKDDRIASYSQNIEIIERLLTRKRAELEAKIANFDQQMAGIMKNVDQERIRLERLERQKYFENIYFDTKEREVQQQSESDEFERMLEEELKRSELEDILKEEARKKRNSNQDE